MFYEICIYEAKPNKEEEIEQLMKEVAEFYRAQKGVITVNYIKRTHRQKDFDSVKKGEPPIRLTKVTDKITYVLYWELESAEVHAALCQSALEKFYKRWTRCLTTMPKILLGESVVPK
jgi:quinol monooxygenase YgiN